ncbi:MAG: hypothetical protein IBX62_01755 [Coriobacteriia bacterium]|nr:hypothetical protein [Coriobacteriia bacterium]
MDCLSAQQTLSEAFDAEAVEARRLAEVQRHCAACAPCRAFAAGLESLRVPGPVAPASLAPSVMRRVAEDDAALAAAAVATARWTKGAAGRVEEVPAEDGPEAEPAPRPRPPPWRSPGRLAAAAALIVGFGLLTHYGITLMTTPMIRDGSSGAPAALDAESPFDTAGEQGYPGDAESATGGRSRQGDVASPAPQMVAFEGRAYRVLGSRETTQPPELAGSARTARDGSGPAESVAVHRDPDDAETILIADEAGRWTAFRLVKRTLGGRDYALASDTIERFGDWPRLPGSLPEPASPDGSPTFSPAGADDAGVTVFTPPGRSAEEGFAVAPDTAAGDPAAGNPFWTWWEPL